MDAQPFLRLQARGQSVWLQGLHRRMLTEGSLAHHIKADALGGVAASVSDIVSAISVQSEYAAPVADLLAGGAHAPAVYEALALADAARAADLFASRQRVSAATAGWVSVAPAPTADEAQRIARAREWWRRLERPNAMIELPAPRSSLAALQRLLAEGVSVHASPVFSVARYEEILEAYLRALEQRLARRADLTTLCCVTGFALVRLDRRVDELLDAHAGQGRGEARALRGRASLAVASTAYLTYLQTVQSARFERLARAGARAPLLLWASMASGDPGYSELKYIEEFLAPETIQCLRPEALAAFRDHGKVGAGLAAHREETARVLRELATLHIDLEHIAEQLAAQALELDVEALERLQRWLRERPARR